VTCNEATPYEDSDSDEEDEIPEEVVREVENFAISLSPTWTRPK